MRYKLLVVKDIVIIKSPQVSKPIVFKITTQGVHTFNLSTQEVKAGRTLEFEANLGYIKRPAKVT